MAGATTLKTTGACPAISIGFALRAAKDITFPPSQHRRVEGEADGIKLGGEPDNIAAKPYLTRTRQNGGKRCHAGPKQLRENTSAIRVVFVATHFPPKFKVRINCLRHIVPFQSWPLKMVSFV
jgi:hypothetical protein